jgi:EmrB/QacA subfamily drug resistance transporter
MQWMRYEANVRQRHPRGTCLFSIRLKLTPMPPQGDSESSVEVDPAPVATAEKPTSRQAFLQVFPGVMVAMFLAAADQTILASALPTIAGSLGGLADLSWVVIAYLLAATIAAPLYGHLGDRFGRRRMLLGALAIFTAASLACALAPTLLLLIAARAVQGLGGGGLMTLAQALIGEHVSPRERGRYSGYFATVFALASTSGPVLGAYLTEHLSWRAVFAVNLPLGLVAAILAWRIPQAKIIRQGRFRPDITGALLFTMSALALLFALSSGGNRFEWRSWPMAALAGGALIGFALLVIWERRAADPVIPLRFFAVPAIIRSDAVVICFAAALFSTILYLPLYLQLGRGLGIGQSGLLLLPITLSMVASSTITGRLVTRTGEVKLFPQAGLALATLAYLLLAATVSAGSTLTVLSLTVLAGAGLGMVMPPTQVAVQHAAGRDSLGAATATISVSRAVGGAIGVAIVGAILFAMLATPDGVTSAAVREVIEGGPVYFDRLSEGERATLTASLDQAYRVIFVVIAATTALGALVARTIPSPKWT